MGLAGRKVKQRISADPRNLAWIDDSSKFGEKYLQSLGWTSGQGLGLTGDGRADNIKIHQKLDLLGIGSNRRGPEGDDWRAGREYDRLLNRLNQTQDTTHELELASLSGFNKASTSEPSHNDESQTTTTKKKRKRSPALDDAVEEKRAKKLRKKEQKAKEKKEKKEKKNKKEDAKGTAEEDSLVPAQNDIPNMPTTTGPPYRAHRKRHLASKRLAAASSQSMKEILGISTTAAEDDTAKSLTVSVTTVSEESTTHSETHLLRKSEKSMADYFSEKLRLKKQQKP